MDNLTPEPMVYVVTDGDYSDYHIFAVFDNEPAAQAYADNLGANVEKYSLNSTTPHACNYFEATVCDVPGTEGHGSAGVGVYERHTDDWVTLRAQGPTAWCWTAKDRQQPTDAYYGSAVALTADLALKIAQDEMRQYKALRELSYTTDTD